MLLAVSQTLTFLKQRFAEVGLELNARHGQNFLIDLNLVRMIVDAAELTPDDVVLEVGTGAGSLSAMMALLAGHVVTVEIDPRLYQLASEELIDFPNITMLHLDGLKNKNTIAPEVLEAVRGEMARRPGSRFKLVANLAYNIATPLMTNLLALDDPPSRMVVTIQKEVAERMVAKPSTKDYGALAIWVQCQANVEIVRVMPPSVFWPRPKVDSAIVRIDLDEAKRSRIADRSFFHRFVRALFLHRRKYLRGVLLAAFKREFDKPNIDAILAKLELPPEARAEQLNVEQTLALGELIRSQLPNAGQEWK